MRSRFTFLNLIVVSVLFTLSCYAQEEPSPEFPIGAFMSIESPRRYDQDLYNSFDSSGMNIVVQYADDNNKQYLNNTSVIPFNGDNQSDWIMYYATGLYSKWESEEDQQDLNTVGVKHKYGVEAEWDGIDCWSSIGLAAPKDSLVYGPHYRQERKYRRGYNNCWYCATVGYRARFRIALDNPDSVSQNETVCRIKIVHRYKIHLSEQTSIIKDTVLSERVLLVSDFDQEGNFSHFEIPESPDVYEYDARFHGDEFERMQLHSSEYPNFTDWESDNGIQFVVDWLRNDELCTLYIDYAEVYDNDGWDDYIISPNIVINRITTYTQSYSTWSNLKFWYGQDEPYTIDAIMPMQIVDSLVQAAGGAPLITAYLLGWFELNGDPLHRRYFQRVQPEFMMIDWFAFNPDNDTPTSLETLRNIFQEAHLSFPDFWYVPQAFGLKNTDTGEWCHYRKPDSTEFKAMNFLALSHGVKGILNYNYDVDKEGYSDPCNIKYDCIVNKNGNNFDPTVLWYVIRNNIAPRLKGKLGKTLLKLDYTGNYINLEYQEGPPVDADEEYLEIQHYGFSFYWHAGFFEKVIQPDNKHFLLTNLRTSFPATAKLYISNTTNYQNVSFTDVEGGEGRADTTIGYNSSITYYETMPAGDGRLYRVAPVIKYGGKLIVNDTIKTNETLLGDMTIETGVNLVIKDANIYTIKDTITLEGTGFIKGTGYVSLEDDGWIDINSWNYSAFKGREGDHPKIIWGTYPGIGVVTNYKVYRKIESGGWTVITSVSSNARDYIDSTVTIATTGGNNLQADYKVTAVRQLIGESSYSNIITYKAENKLGKGTGEATEKFTYSLSENYPNPFNPTTTINYSLERDGLVELEVLDILGRRVAMLVDEKQAKGNHSVSFNATKLSSGIYLYRIKAGKFVQVKKMVLVK